MPAPSHRLVIGTTNAAKGRELAELLAPYGFLVETLRDHPETPEVDEDGDTFAHNARKKAVETADLRRALEEASGRDLEQYFQQWVYGRGVPRLEVEYAWDLTSKRARVSVRRTWSPSPARRRAAMDSSSISSR